MAEDRGLPDGEAAEGRKRRGSVEDAKGAPVYTGDPLPPYISMMEDLVYVLFRFDRDRVLPFLPPGLTPTAENLGVGCLYRHGAGWGITHVTAAFFSVAVEEFAAPDTSESCFILAGFMDPPQNALFARHYGDFRPGHAEIIGTGARVDVSVNAGGRQIVHCAMTMSGEVSRDMCANDRYLGLNAAGDLVSFIGSVTGDSYPGALLALDFTEDAPPVLQALQPTELIAAGMNPRLLLTWSVPDRLRLAGETALMRAGRETLLDLLDRQTRACAILSDKAWVLQANTEATRLLASLPPERRAPLRLPDLQQQTRFAAAVAAASAGRMDRAAGRFLLPRPDGRAPLVAQLAPVDPALAGPGTAMLLLSDLAARPQLGDTGLLQLLGLTPAEARIAAAVGAGLPPREAAARLGLAESTVRSSLKVVFGKLGVARQAELVQLIARLEAR